jgi:hypothetical protein
MVGMKGALEWPSDGDARIVFILTSCFSVFVLSYWIGCADMRTGGGRQLRDNLVRIIFK